MTERVTQLTGNETTVGTKRPWVRNDRGYETTGYETTVVTQRLVTVLVRLWCSLIKLLSNRA